MAFSTAVFTLADTSRPSGVVHTEFGYHVFLITELIPAHSVPFEERRRSLEPEIVNVRASKLEEAALARSRAERRVDVERSALELAAKVDVNR
jgi:parvulin-like peptidyl-prolyl isomerase